MSRILNFLLIGILFSGLVLADNHTAETDIKSTETTTSAQIPSVESVVDELEEPLFTPFIERYVLDEMKQLRVDMAAQKHELMQQVVDREHNAIDRAISYATDTVTYFFYLIAGATSILVIVGWTSIRDIKERVHSLADEEISKLIHEYEGRLAGIERQLKQKTKHIEQNREELELTQKIQSLWLRAQQDSSAVNKIVVYDEILQLSPNDCEALTYKADAVLELNEPQWAANLCRKALRLDPENSHAFYQLACAYAAMDSPERSMQYLREALERSESYLNDIADEPAFDSMRDYPPLQELLQGRGDEQF